MIALAVCTMYNNSIFLIKVVSKNNIKMNRLKKTKQTYKKLQES